MDLVMAFLIYGLFILSAIGFKAVLDSSLKTRSEVVRTWQKEVEFRRKAKRPAGMSVEEWVIPPMDKLAVAKKQYLQLERNLSRYLVSYVVAGLIGGFLILQSIG